MYAIRSYYGNSFFVAAYGPRFDRDLEAVYEGRFKLIDDGLGAPRLFDLDADPGERADLAAAKPEVVRRLGLMLERWRETAVPREGAAPVELTPDRITSYNVCYTKLLRLAFEDEPSSTVGDS